jgi:hypothetical protein
VQGLQRHGGAAQFGTHDDAKGAGAKNHHRISKLKLCNVKNKGGLVVLI